MKKQVISKLLARGAIYLMSGALLLSMVAAPAMAVIAANSVDSAAIIDGAIRSEDIHNRAVKRRKIGKRVIRTEHVRFISERKINYSYKTRYISIPVAALAETTSGYDYERTSSLRMVSGSGSFYAPVNLPKRAVVRKIRYYALDNVLGAGNNTTAWMYRIDNWGNVMMVAGTQTSINLPSWQVLTGVANHTINNNAHAYYVEVSLGGANTNLRAGKIVIKYAFTKP